MLGIGLCATLLIKLSTFVLKLNEIVKQDVRCDWVKIYSLFSRFLVLGSLIKNKDVIFVPSSSIYVEVPRNGLVSILVKLRLWTLN